MVNKITLQTLLLFCLNVMFGQEQISDYAFQQERIIRFHTDIAIDADGRIEVAEHITVYAAGEFIKRGIVRELPLSREDKDGKNVRVKYNILAVKCNGEDAQYHTEKESRYLEIYVGETGVLLKPGVYEYIFAYETYGQIGFFDDFDELYWNVTGNGWVFPVEQASASITLPDGAQVVETNGYTGAYGVSGNDCTVKNRGNVQTFTTTRTLDSREGLTVSVCFTRDIIDRSRAAEVLNKAYWDSGAMSGGLVGLFICAVYCFVTLLTKGRRSYRPVAIPTFKPPCGWTPAFIRQVTRRERLPDNKGFTASLVDMAVKGSMIIKCEKKKLSSAKYTLINTMNTERLSPEEKEAHAELFKKYDELDVDRENRYTLLKAGNRLTQPYHNYEDFYKDNFGVIGIGGILLNIVFAVYYHLTDRDIAYANALMLASPFIAMVFQTMVFCIDIGKNPFMKWVSIGFGVVATFAVLFFECIEVLEEGGSGEVHWLSVLFFAVPSLLFWLYARRMKMLTEDGARFAAEYEGFKMYMKTAEEHRLNMLTPPERTPELFEKLLPYAIALDLSNEWCQKFGDVLERCNYNPGWYSSNVAFTGMSAASFASTFTSLSSTLSSRVSSASSSGSGGWSSGSGGGGFSGGGGGGGGVRGR